MNIRLFALLALALLPRFCQAATQLNYTAYTFTTVAGRVGTTNVTDGPGYLARFYRPYGMAFDTNGNLFIADTFNSSVRKMSPAGNQWTVSTIATGFSYPYGVAVDTNGIVYVADTLNNAVKKVTPSGSNWVVSPFATGLATPTGLAVDTNGNVYVAENATSVIRKITPSGTVSTLAGMAGSTGTNDGTGSSARFFYPTTVALDSAGNVYVTDTDNDTIRKVSPLGVVTTLAGLGGSGGLSDGTGALARFSQPEGIALDDSGNVFVTDSSNSTVRKITPAGVVTTLGGLPPLTGYADGSGPTARFHNPRGIAVNAQGIIFVADSENSVVRQGVLPVPAPVIVTSSMAFVGGHFSFALTGTEGERVVVQASANLTNWSSIWTNTFGTSPLTFTDPQPNVYPERFYRAFTP